MSLAHKKQKDWAGGRKYTSARYQPGLIKAPKMEKGPPS
jgi:hypothetical protein